MNRHIGPAKAGHILSLLKINQLLEDSTLTAAEKRAILASWISDARAVANMPHLRQLDDGVFISVDELLLALKSLDHDDEPQSISGPAPCPDLPPLAA